LATLPYATRVSALSTLLSHLDHLVKLAKTTALAPSLFTF
jgi:hypothetical protein